MKATDFKFKAWSKTEKKFIKSKDLVNANNLPVISTKLGFKLKSRYELFQSSGLKDSNDVEIYDGDVLHILAGKKHLRDSTHVVYYEDGSFLIDEGANEVGEPTILLLCFALKMWNAKKMKIEVVGHFKTIND